MQMVMSLYVDEFSGLSCDIAKDIAVGWLEHDYDVAR